MDDAAIRQGSENRGFNPVARCRGWLSAAGSQTGQASQAEHDGLSARECGRGIGWGQHPKRIAVLASQGERVLWWALESCRAEMGGNFLRFESPLVNRNFIQFAFEVRQTVVSPGEVKDFITRGGRRFELGTDFRPSLTIQIDRSLSGFAYDDQMMPAAPG